jgi:hypothetical protein
MSGRRIDDMGGMPHTSDMSMKSKNHVKHYESADGKAAHIGMEYPDTTEMIHRDQEHGIKKASGHQIKPGYRN